MISRNLADSRKKKEKTCVYLPKMAFLAARGGRGGGSLFLLAATQRAAVAQVSTTFCGTPCPQSPVRSRGRRLATCTAGRIWVGPLGAIRRVSLAFFSDFRSFAFSECFSSFRFPGSGRGVVTPQLFFFQFLSACPSRHFRFLVVFPSGRGLSSARLLGRSDRCR